MKYIILLPMFLLCSIAGEAQGLTMACLASTTVSTPKPFYRDQPRDNSRTIYKGVEIMVIGGVLCGMGVARIAKDGSNAPAGFYYLAYVGGADIIFGAVTLLVGLHREKMHPTSRYSMIGNRHSMGVALNF